MRGNQARVKNADVRHPSSTVVMHRRKSASPFHNVILYILYFVYLVTSFPKCLHMMPFLLLYICSLSSKSLLCSGFFYPRYLKFDTCTKGPQLIKIFTLWIRFVHTATHFVSVLGIFIGKPYSANKDHFVVCFFSGEFSGVWILYADVSEYCLFHLHRRVPTCVWRWNRQCSETSAYKIQTPGNYPEESTQHLEHGESLKSREDNYILTSRRRRFLGKNIR